jgi:hypothetical protein
MIKIKLNMNLLNYLKGTILTLTNGCKGTKLTSFWKKRIKDSKIDNCITILKDDCSKEKLTLPIDKKTGVVNIPEDSKEYYAQLGNEIDKEEKKNLTKQRGKKPKKRKSK